MDQYEASERQAHQQVGTALRPPVTGGGEDARGNDTRENLLRLWRSAAQVVQSDPVPARRAAYEAAIAEVLAQLPPLTSFEALIESYETISRAAITAMSTRLRSDGRLLNDLVVAGAACWVVLSSHLEMCTSRPS
jgi:hypothetical protein